MCERLTRQKQQNSVAIAKHAYLYPASQKRLAYMRPIRPMPMIPTSSVSGIAIE